jgi:hypothetical protein
MTDKSNDEVYREFKSLVNMAPREIESWLNTDESGKVGQDSGDGESIGRKSAKKIIEIKRTVKDDLEEEDYDHMKKVVSYIRRHKAQEPEQVEESNWLFSLKNWGHDPGKD